MATDPTLVDRLFACCREALGAYNELLADIRNDVVRLERGRSGGPTTDVTQTYRTYLEAQVAELDAVISEYERTLRNRT